MKKVILMSVMAIMMFACKSKSPVNTSTSIKSQVAMKGNWVISSVTYPGSDYIKVTSFDVADSKCFVGSQWKFISNNNKGTLALANGSCAPFSSSFTWYVNRDGEFILKLLYDGEKAKKVRDGFVLKVQDQRESSFQLVDKIDVGGKMTDVVYQFNKQ